MNFDIIQAIFWSLTYVLIIFVGIKHRDENLPSMPLWAGVMNLGWEIIALILNFPVLIHIVWTALDIVIFTLNCIFLLRRKQKKLYLFLYIFSLAALTAVLRIVFNYENGMGFSVFIIDIIMAVIYLLTIKKLSPHLRITIGITKLIGDLFAWLAYMSYHPIFNITGIIVLILNTFYVLYAYYLYTKAYHKQKH